MGVVVRQGALATITSYFGAFLGYFNALYFFPKFLDLDQLGLYRAVQYAAITLVPLAQLGTMTIVVKHYPKYIKDREQYGDFVTFVIGVLLFGFTLFSCLFFAFHEPIFNFFEKNSPQVADYDLLILFAVLAMVFNGVFEAFLRSRLNVFLPSLTREIGLKVGAFIAICLYHYQVISFDWFMGSFLVLNALSAFTLLAHLVKHKAFPLRWPLRTISRRTGLEMVRFGGYALLGSGVLVIIGNVDSIMISGLLGLSEVAIYSTAIMMTMVVDLARKGITQINLPLMAEAFEQQDIKRVSAIYKDTSITLVVIGLLLYVGITSNLQNLYSIMPNGEEFSQGYWVFVLVGAIRVVDMSLANNNAIIQLSPYYRFNIVTVIVLSVSTVLTNLWLIPRYGLNGAAAATFMAITIYGLLRGIFIYAIYRIQPYTWASFKALILALLGLTVGLFLPVLPNVWLDMLVRSVLITLIYLPAVVALKLSPQLNNVVAVAWAKVRK